MTRKNNRDLRRNLAIKPTHFMTCLQVLCL